MKKMMKNFVAATIGLLIFSMAPIAQNSGDLIETEAKGTGLKREDALQDALRKAVGQAAGVALSSETKVENFMVISDAIAAKTMGYINTYTVVKEVPFPDRYEVTIKAKVSTTALKADFSLLARTLGGVRFLVMYDPRNVAESEIPLYDLAVEKLNEYLSGKGYRYIDKKRFEALRKEAFQILEADKSEISYIQRLGMMSDAQFIINLGRISSESKSEEFETRTNTKVFVEARAYDNCTAEGLGTVVMESGRNSVSDKNTSLRTGVNDAITKSAENLLQKFTGYIGDWVNNGTPYELRFYNVGTFRDFRELRNKLKAEPMFGGEMEITAVDNYTKLVCTFKKKPDELADKILDIADAIPAFKEKVLDVRLIYGRQINFAPQNVKVPELDAYKQNTNQASANPNANPANKSTNSKPVGTVASKPASSSSSTNTSNKTATSTKPAAVANKTGATPIKPSVPIKK
jgi:hypothetical protein